jgi:periplasmic protein TonB
MPRSRFILTMDQRGGFIRLLPGLVAGVGISLLILFALSQGQNARTEEPPLLDDLRSVALPPPPPPPPAFSSAQENPPMEIVVPVSAEPTPDAIRVVPAPPQSDFRPAAEVRYDFSPDAFRPSGDGDAGASNRVYSRLEVDERVVVLYRKAPKISDALFRRVPTPRVTVLLVVNADGSVENMHILRAAEPEFDRLIMEAVAQWKFRPAKRKGRNVRQWVELPVIVKPPSGSLFNAD